MITESTWSGLGESSRTYEVADCPIPVYISEDLIGPLYSGENATEGCVDSRHDGQRSAGLGSRACGNSPVANQAACPRCRKPWRIRNNRSVDNMSHVCSGSIAVATIERPVVGISIGK